MADLLNPYPVNLSCAEFGGSLHEQKSAGVGSLTKETFPSILNHAEREEKETTYVGQVYGA